MSSISQVVPDRMIFRKTNLQTGRHVSVSPANSAMQHLSYGRIILNASYPSASFSTGDRETGLTCLSGEASVTAGAGGTNLAKRDSIYIPRDTNVTICTKTKADLAEFSAEVQGQYPLQTVRYAQISRDPNLKFKTGNPGSLREIFMLLAKNVQAGRLLVGFTMSDPGNWTSWPPHEHAKMLEEIYVYFDMPEPAYGIQLVYGNTEYPELVTVVRDGDAVLMPGGYHPNVSVPGHRICFLWAMAAHREVDDRQYGVVNVQPGFSQQELHLQGGRTE